jgi:biopolymer transport protein ExbD
MKLSGIERRAARRGRNRSMVDLNLVSLIDIFTILIFFLLSNTTEVEVLPSTKAVRLPESRSDTKAHDTVVVVVNQSEILVDGRHVASVADAMNAPDELIAPLQAALEQQAKRVPVLPENAAANQTVTIMGDKAIPYDLLRRVMKTCAKANYSNVSFAVQRNTET